MSCKNVTVNRRVTDVDHLCHSKICVENEFCELFILLLDTTFKNFQMVSWHTILLYMEKCPDSVKYQSSTFVVQGT